MASVRAKLLTGSPSLRETLLSAGLDVHLADLVADIPHREMLVEPRRPFRESGSPLKEVIFVRSGILAKVKGDSAGRRQIVALRFAGEGILPHDMPPQYAIHAIVRSEVLIARAEDFEPLVEANPELQRFLRRQLQRDEAIGHEWLVNCGRRDSTARVAHLLCETVTRMHGDHEHMLNPFTQQQIADITGQTSVNVNRVLADLERHGLIRRKGRQIDFVDWSEIRRVASFQPAYLE
jgi:CRP-like cAMP-binding protein